MKVLVCGSRTWNEPLLIYRRIALLPPDAEIIHGGAFGPDTLAAEYAASIGLTVHPPFLPAWEKYGKRAGFMRTFQMLDERPDLVLAFYDGSSRGTGYTIQQAYSRGIPVEIIYPSDKFIASAKLPGI